MEINDQRVKKIVDKFLDDVYKIDLMSEYLSDIVFVPLKRSHKQVDENTIAYLVKSKRKIVREIPKTTTIPTYRICLIKERVSEYSDEDILFTLGHEMSHILINLVKDNKQPESLKLVERACDILSEHFFGYRKPKNSQVGYL